MIVERIDNEIRIRLKAGRKAAKIQALLDYLKYEEITSDIIATQEQFDELVNEAKKGRLNRIKQHNE